MPSAHARRVLRRARWRLRQTLPNGQSLTFEYTGPPPAIPTEYA